LPMINCHNSIIIHFLNKKFHGIVTVCVFYRLGKFVLVKFMKINIYNIYVGYFTAVSLFAYTIVYLV